jgi:cytoskeletal protein CcmA (bactofilin family)
MTRPGNGATERVSLLGPRSELTGDLVTTEGLVILGRLDGRCVRSPNITIGPMARVCAKICAKHVRIEGIVIGDVYAEDSVVIQASATVYGSIHSPQITIHEGAEVNGPVHQSPWSAAGEQQADLHEGQLQAAKISR